MECTVSRLGGAGHAGSENTGCTPAAMCAAVAALWGAVARQDAETMRCFFAPHAAVLWHNSGEYFDLEDYLRANCEYPGDWRGQAERVESLGPDTVVAVARVWLADGSAAFHAVGFYRFEAGRIVRADEYWGDDGPPPAWRKEKGLGRPIRPEDLV